MKIAKEIEVKRLQNDRSELFERDVLHILNGQIMYEEFKRNSLLGDSDFVPFNEAMCVHTTTEHLFNQEFIDIRATGHHVSAEEYMEKVIAPLTNLINKEYRGIVLWFGEDMFCQMNLLTILSYLEQSGYEGRVFLNSFKEDEFKVHQTELKLGQFYSVYKEVLVHHTKPSYEPFPIMNEAINIYLEMQNEHNAVVSYIDENKHLSTKELLNRLFELFPNVGYGDLQYMELINKRR